MTFSRSNRHAVLAALAIALAATGLFRGASAVWDFSAKQLDTGEQELSEREQARQELTDALGGADRYLSYLNTDKPLYRPGETAYFRTVVLHHATQAPMQTEQYVQGVIEITGPKGDVVASGNAQLQESVLGYSWEIPEELAGGQYTMKVSFPYQGYVAAERTFEVRAYRAPRLRSQIEFLRDGYGPGDKVVATLEVSRAEGGIPAGAGVTVVARVDGQEVYREASTVDASGHCTTQFDLPEAIARGEGTLAMVIDDGGAVETASKTIPILLQTVDLTMYPEGGELVAVGENRVYFEAFTPTGKPADLAGVIVDSQGREVGCFSSEHEGRGRFVISPNAGEQYSLRITEPAGITTEYPLPEVQATGTRLRATQEVYAADESIEFLMENIHSGEGGVDPARVTLSKRDRLIAECVPQLQGGQGRYLGRISFELAEDAPTGVLVATAWDAEGNPLAERLIYRQPAESVQISITPNADRYVPGGTASLTITTTNAAGEPISAIVGLTVTDDTVREMIETRDQAPSLPVMVLLESEVNDLADAEVYLDSQNEQAPLAVDLLLGTQGWRRFAFVDTTQFVADHGDDARRILALQMVTHQERQRMEAHGNNIFSAGEAAPRAPEENFLPGVDAAEPLEAPLAPAPVDPNDQEEQAGEPPVADDLDQFQGAQPELEEEANELREQLQRELDEHPGEQQGIAGQGIVGEDFPSRVAAPNAFVAIRVYAHQVREDRQPGDRIDFAETLYWNAAIKTDDAGQATVEFGMNDSVTSFRVLADAFSAEGALGNCSTTIESVKPFYTEPKLPLEVTAGDTILLPLGLINATENSLAATLAVEGHEALSWGNLADAYSLAANQRLRTLLPIEVGPYQGDAQFTLDAIAGPYADRVTRSVRVVPRGFPTQLARGGLLDASSQTSHTFIVPESVVPGSITTEIAVYPTPLSNMTAALEALIREPCGCFEQTSSSNYPLVMAQQYFLSHQGIDPALISRSKELIGRGYDRLLGFECASGGYEWFGEDPGHEALTAYGLLEFSDMSEVFAVDQSMVERTRDWLMAQRDGEGGFTRERRALHTWVATPEISNAYILWALLTAGDEGDLSEETAWVRQAAETTENTYVKALAANALALAGDVEGLNHLLDTLGSSQNDDGSLSGATTSIVGSGGDALAIETTALAVLAWLQHPAYAHNAEKSIQFLAESCKSGRYGSTQSTILALRAIVAYDASRARPKAPGELLLCVDGQPVGEPLSFDELSQGMLELPNIESLLLPGEHELELRMSDGSQMPYSMTVNYHSITPATSPECQMELAVSLAASSVGEGEVTEANVTVVNRSDEPVPTPVAIIGIPGGLEVRHEQLQELVDAGRIAAYEVRGREVVLYWRSFAESERVELPLSLVAAVPGQYTAPASRTYLYYTDEHKMWVEGMEVEITPLAQN